MNITDDVFNAHKIDSLIFSKNKLVESLDFEAIPSLIVEKDLFGTLYLSYLDKFIDDCIEQRILIKITKEKLSKVKDGSISIRDAFGNPEADDVYVVRFREDTGEVEIVSVLPASLFSSINPIDSSYTIEIESYAEVDSENNSDVSNEELISQIFSLKSNEFFQNSNNNFISDENQFRKLTVKDIPTGNYYGYRN